MLTPEQAFFADMVNKESGIVLEHDKGYLLDSRLLPVAKDLGHATLKSFHEAIKSNVTADVKQRIVEALTTNESLFFRDMTPFRILQQEPIPDFREKGIDPVRVWCAAASTGQEPYSIAMSFLDTWPTVTPQNSSILATDIDREVIKKGKSGIFSQIEVNRGLPVMMLAKYFEQEGTQFAIAKKVRDFVTWRQLNLITPFFVSGPFDLIFIRNVPIYFSPAMKKTILERLCTSLKADGILFLGSSESTVGITSVFEAKISEGGGVIYRKRKAG